MRTELEQVYARLFAAFGAQHWWPAESPFEVMVGAVLVQNTAWRNVERAIENLRDAGLMHPTPLYALSEHELGELIRPAGYYRVKAQRLRNLLRFVVDSHNASLDDMFATDSTSLRRRLLGIRGIGPETADAILLYAGGHATFVVDTYTHRILARHGWIGYDATYDEIKELFETNLPDNVALYNEYHALLVRVGKDYCRRSQPKCEACPLACMLPASGIMSPM